ncbi:hypothetical protein Enr13x_44730 [Stieleria neptunia]|uniref:Uncharacterized protein n=1 Tax=Stieleria neptunia TaxID=2527979 RepID=A0A518HUR8_9BACT|nr:hypothetical protein [Stieleria neptunia]QDV44605.1 hypothetical protein Enr13x_44730 [Stieleria neptunia]
MPQLKFSKTCPICGRKSLIPVYCLGKKVTCGHCHGDFRATDTTGSSEQGSELMDRAEALLATNGIRRHNPAF